MFTNPRSNLIFFSNFVGLSEIASKPLVYRHTNVFNYYYNVISIISKMNYVT